MVTNLRQIKKLKNFVQKNKKKVQEMNNDNKTSKEKEKEKVGALGSGKFFKHVENNGEFVQCFLQYIVKHIN